MMEGSVCAPRPVKIDRIKRDCPTCEKETIFQEEVYEWYGGQITCLMCGDRWNEDGRANRPFARNWKVDRLDGVNRTWEKWRDEK